jgi:hypothetical protein
MCYFSSDAVGRSEVNGSKVSVFINEKLRDRGECGANEQNNKKPVTPFDYATSASTPQYKRVFAHDNLASSRPARAKTLVDLGPGSQPYFSHFRD